MASHPRFDIDTYLNPITPRSRLHRLPRPISHFLGYRPPNSKATGQIHILLVWTWCFIGAFCGVALIEGVYIHLPRLSGHQVPLIIASFGAAAILEYNTIESPLAQPRNLVLGHFLSALIGVCITKLFRLLPVDDFESLRWLAGALSVGAASVLMSVTKTVHPPAGATALLAATSVEITDLSWWLLPLVLLGCLLMLASALIINNINRRFPMYWWTPADLGALHDRRKSTTDVETASQAIKEDRKERTPSDSETEVGSEKHEPVQPSNRDALRLSLSQDHDILISKDRIVVPDWFEASDWELSILHILQERVASGRPESSTE